MRRMIRLPALLLCILFAVSLVAGPAAAGPKIEKIRTPGGIEVWFVREPAIPIIALQAAWRGGSASDPVGKEGLAALTTDLLTEGAGDLNADEFQDAMREKAISLSFGADRDYITLGLRTLSEHSERAFDLLRLAMTAPRFDEEPVARLRARALVSYQRGRTNPNVLAGERFADRAFPGHPYGLRSAPTPESLEKITTADFAAFTKQALARDNLLIGAVGDIEPDYLAQLVDDSFGRLPDKATLPLPAPATLQTPAAPEIIQFPNPQSVVLFGAPGLLRDDPDWYAATVLNNALGGGSMSSRLFEEVREKRGLVYSIGTQLTPYKAAGLFSGSLATSNAQVGAALQLVRDEFARIVRDGLTPEELAASKAYLTGSFPLRLSSNAAIAGMLVAMQISGLGTDYIEQYPKLINAVTAEDVRRVAQRLLDRENLLVVVVGQPVGLGG
ncbi:MAG TPA: pitrilysin family protein [Ferrovibrio sp.]|uniref:M16 family metallopeptidase n=1 Tax=Ferrovibrio sp. TaxID=1917215 RepID=UPI002B4B1873|nr:pitrilysin family protein [Ferrovibrio sp.]HLT76707.1 pitrilysin family protein [Ferrovibrio sp.]